MESTRPIRALMRGLDALVVLNSRDGATVSEIAHEIRLPRTTVYRIVETLCHSSFVFRDITDDRYRLTIRARTLSEGFDDDGWLTAVALPALRELSRHLIRHPHDGARNHRPRSAVERYLPKLRQCAAKMGNSISELLAGVRQDAVPAAAV